MSDILNESIFHVILNWWIRSTINILLIDSQLTFWLFFEYLSLSRITNILLLLVINHSTTLNESLRIGSIQYPIVQLDSFTLNGEWIAEREGERERSRFFSFWTVWTFWIVKLIGGSYFCRGMAELSTEFVELRIQLDVEINLFSRD